MSYEENKGSFEDGAFVGVIVMVVLILACFISCSIGSESTQKEALSNGAAHYELSGETAVFMWGPPKESK